MELTFHIYNATKTVEKTPRGGPTALTSFNSLVKKPQNVCVLICPKQWKMQKMCAILKNKYNTNNAEIRETFLNKHDWLSSDIWDKI